MANGFVWRVCIVACVALACFAAGHSNLGTTHTVTREVVINRNETPPDGLITRAECADLRGKSIQEVVYQYGLPKTMGVGSYIDSLHYPLRNAPSEAYECNVYFDNDNTVDRVNVDI